ncbi:MAG: riboflavin synthase [Thermodesulfobacteriota bacterium]|nr:riboflavin synthase [Thermodesulfobacteriota bacterium]
MFTGIIQGLGTLRDVRQAGQSLVLTIHPDFSITDPQEGESIAVNGVCLTAASISHDVFSAEVSPETLSRTTLSGLRVGSRVNLERALRLSDRLGGHLVSGHVDGIGEVIEKENLSQFTLFTIAIPKILDRYIIEKGSVAIDGISLTVNSCSKGRFSVVIIPHTAKLTTMGSRKRGDKINIEVDLIGKYIEKLLLAGHIKTENPTNINTEFLAQHGFL